MTLTSDGYRDLLQEMHERQPWGTKGRRYADDILAMCGRLGVREVLDYGCGRETLRDALAPDVTVRGYDPAIPHLASDPAPADIVACTDVLEHIEPDCLDEVLKHIAGLARRGVYFAIALNLAKRHLPDGRNAHLIVRPSGWWTTRLRVIFDERGYRFDRHAIGKKWLISEVVRR